MLSIYIYISARVGPSGILLLLITSSRCGVIIKNNNNIIIIKNTKAEINGRDGGGGKSLRKLTRKNPRVRRRRIFAYDNNRIGPPGRAIRFINRYCSISKALRRDSYGYDYNIVIT